jgi:hypothetical protein
MLVYQPSSRALCLQVPLPTIRARAPLDLYVLIAIKRAALLVLPSRSNRRLAEAEGFAFSSSYPAELPFLPCLAVMRSPG